MTSPTNTESALLLLDLQNEMVEPAGKIGAHGLAAAASARNVVANAAHALVTARDRGMLVVHVRLGFRPDYADCLSVAPRIATLKANGAAQLGTWGTEFPKELTPRDDEFIVTKQCVNPFFNTGLLHTLTRKGIRQLYIGGVATNLVVEATARAADDAGFAVTVLEDLCAAPNPEWHEFAIRNMLPVFGAVSDSRNF